MFGFILMKLAFSLIAFAYVLHPIYVYLKDTKKLRRFPGVSIAPLTNAWSVFHQYFHTRTVAVHEAHQKHGKVVRVGPDHVSFATLEAIRNIYGHGTPMTKDNFYSTFTSTHLNVSDAQEKSVHNVKRRRFAAAFAQKSIVELEMVMGDHLSRLVAVLDAKSGQEVDMKQMMLYLMFDAISVMLYNQDPNYLERGSTEATAETVTGKIYRTDLYQALCGSLRVSTSLGWAPKSISRVKAFTKWHSDWKSGDHLRDITIHFVRNRLRMDTERIKAGLGPINDFMTTLLWDKNNQALGLEFGELVTEAQNLFNAAGENTEIALTNIIWLLARTPRVVVKLRKELDKTFAKQDDPTTIPTYNLIKDLPYLRACIDEGLRLRPSLPGGLPRTVPPEGMRVSGEWVEGGTTVSVSTYTVHRDPTIFNNDAENYVPERWLQSNSNELQRGFLAFSQGGRACIGRNIAYFEMQLIIATLFNRYDFSLRSANWELGIVETFSAHTKALPMKVTRRK